MDTHIFQLNISTEKFTNLRLQPYCKMGKQYNTEGQLIHLK